MALGRAWGGYVNYSMWHTPDIGRQGNRYWLQGYSSHDVLPSPAAARAVSDALLGEDEALAPYQHLRNPKFPGGQRFVTPLEALGKAYYRLRDLF